MGEFQSVQLVLARWWSLSGHWDGSRILTADSCQRHGGMRDETFRLPYEYGQNHGLLLDCQTNNITRCWHVFHVQLASLHCHVYRLDEVDNQNSAVDIYAPSTESRRF